MWSCPRSRRIRSQRGLESGISARRVRGAGFRGAVAGRRRWLRSGGRPKVADSTSLWASNPCLVSLRTAEMIKYACNAFHAVKIAFANEIGALSDRLGIDGHEVMDTLCSDVQAEYFRGLSETGLRIRRLLPAEGPARTRSIAPRVSTSKLPLLESMLPSNEQHLDRAIEACSICPPQRIGVIGLAFKENTDDLRESPVVAMLEQTDRQGSRRPRIRSAYRPGKHLRFQSQFHPGDHSPHRPPAAPAPRKILGWADHLVVAQKQNERTMQRIQHSGLPVMAVVDGSLACAAAAHAFAP